MNTTTETPGYVDACTPEGRVFHFNTPYVDRDGDVFKALVFDGLQERAGVMHYGNHIRGNIRHTPSWPRGGTDHRQGDVNQPFP